MNPFRKKNQLAYDYAVVRNCVNCTTPFAGRYCSMCGEKVLIEDDRSLKHYLSDLFNAFTFIDGKFFRSLRSLILSPGTMSSSVSRGIRQPYMKPIAFFFVANFIYFLFPVFNIFNTSLAIQLDSVHWQFNWIVFTAGSRAIWCRNTWPRRGRPWKNLRPYIT
jgi:hypothetical protein